MHTDSVFKWVFLKIKKKLESSICQQYLRSLNCLFVEADIIQFLNKDKIIVTFEFFSNGFKRKTTTSIIIYNLLN